MTLDEVIAHRSAFRTEYQGRGLAKRYQSLVKRVRDAAIDGGYGDALPRAVAINYAKLPLTRTNTKLRGCSPMASSKNSSAISSRASSSSTSTLRHRSWVAARTRSAVQRSAPLARGVLSVFRTLAKFRFLRGTPLDIFGYSADRKLERELIAGYEKDVATVLGLLSPVTHDTAVEILSLPDRIRGYGPVKEKAAQTRRRATRNSPPTSSTRHPRRGRSRRSNAVC